MRKMGVVMWHPSAIRLEPVAVMRCFNLVKAPLKMQALSLSAQIIGSAIAVV